MTELHATATLKDSAFKTLADSFATFYSNTIAIDQQHRITWISKGYRQFLGLSHNPVGEPITRYIHNSFLPRVSDSGEPVLLELLWVKQQWTLVSVIPLQSDQGEVIGAFGFVALEQRKGFHSLANRFNQMQQQLDNVTQELNQARQNKYRLSQITGRSEQLQNVKHQIRQAARFDISVLLTGETGTGKEMFAHALHELSARSHNAFVSLNVAAIPNNLIEAEFFGVAPGAYTGASNKGRKGKLELADGGTLFLDEIGDMPLELQSKLLRALQEQEFEPLGSNKVKKVNIRIVAATSRNLPKMVENGEFRADLYYRLNAMPIHLPPLRERQADIDLIAERLLDELCIRLHLPVKYLTPDAINLLCQHSWPGNVRELQNLLERAVIMAEEHTEIDVQLIQSLLVPTAQFQQTAQTQPISPRIDPNTGLPIYTISSANRLSPNLPQVNTPPQPLHEQIARAERKAIETALAYTQGHKVQTAKLLGISRASLYEKMRKLDIQYTKNS
ncbi:sigma-54 interaction domain-containing protein [Vibrio natriegens]|uniref:sigma-54 interaction domain-containing protein n=1 Tax=Vibrio natriegens TaxID=691 RepID=UPI003B5932EC